MPDSDRAVALTRIRSELVPGRRVVLTTHLNADGDGAGSEAALAHYLLRKGLFPTIVNPTPYPEQFVFLLGDLSAHTPADREGRGALGEADVVMLLDTSEPSRLGSVLPHLQGRRLLTLDHHPGTAASIGDPALRDPAACATGELVYDLLLAEGTKPTRLEAMGLYVAIATDTGSFRFSNTRPRTHEIAAALIRAGVEPGEMYRRLYADFSTGRLELVRRALSRLRVHGSLPVAWIRLTNADLIETGTVKEDLEGIVEYPRRMKGVEVALLFRELPDGRTKVSLRSTGPANVAAVARALGGGGHDKAAGVVIASGLDDAEALVLDTVSRAL